MTTDAGRALLAALDRQREALPDRDTYASQKNAQQDVLAYAFAFIIEPAIAAIENESAQRAVDGMAALLGASHPEFSAVHLEAAIATVTDTIARRAVDELLARPALITRTLRRTARSMTSSSTAASSRSTSSAWTRATGGSRSTWPTARG